MLPPPSPFARSHTAHSFGDQPNQKGTRFLATSKAEGERAVQHVENVEFSENGFVVTRLAAAGGVTDRREGGGLGLAAASPSPNHLNPPSYPHSPLFLSYPATTMLSSLALSSLLLASSSSALSVPPRSISSSTSSPRSLNLKHTPHGRREVGPDGDLRPWMKAEKRKIESKYIRRNDKRDGVSM